MITDGQKWHCLALKCGPYDDKKWCNLAEKSLSRLIRGITSNNNGDLFKLFSFIRNKRKTQRTQKSM